jgi:hypothetical protein
MKKLIYTILAAVFSIAAVALNVHMANTGHTTFEQTLFIISIFASPICGFMALREIEKPMNDCNHHGQK